MDRAPAVILAVDDDGEALAHLDRVLRSRYGMDYEIVCEVDAAAAGRRLEQLRAQGRMVAVVLADQWLGGGTGIELLASVRTLHPLAKRGLLVSRGDWSVREPMVRAIALGQMDGFLPKPARTPDEQFHRLVTEYLDEWHRAQAPPFVAVRLVGEQWHARCAELRDLLGRNGISLEFCPVASPAGQNVLERAGLDGARLPVVELFTGEVLVDPSNERLADAFGVTEPPVGTVDVAIVGAGPAGLAAAVAAASEGLSTVLLDREGIGGQAGTSSLIRNYLGFPRGVGGAELASRAFEQAWLFGARPYLVRPAEGVRPGPDGFTVAVSGGPAVTARSVVIATGVSYRRLGIPSLEALVGAGVYYGAAVSEAQALAGRRVCVVGGGNSAGQAAVHLAKFAAQVTILVRSASLAASMSSYLIGEIEADPRIDIRYGAELAGGRGEGQLEAVTVVDRAGGEVADLPVAALFVLIGAEPRTGWLPPEIERDDWGSSSPAPAWCARDACRPPGRSHGHRCRMRRASPACSQWATSGPGR
ncbi:MAG: FAD-dependent oxidoreductase [Acidimicrobiales bacterium]|nr:FAD-dependent oxidoreductase [Acidimicrobiales bacterium]